MTLTVGKYTFTSWLRRGIAGAIVETDTLGAADGAAKERATVPVDVLVNTTPVHKEFLLHGPGDLLGINHDAVVRTEPRDWVTDHEPNYLAFIEFYDEDFLWRYTPARALGDRLRPWLALAVLEAETPEHPGEFTLDDRRLPLPTITVASAASLPPHDQTWAWAHVHTNEAFPNESDFARFLESLNEPDHPNADRIICRLTSPRRLAPNTAYGAFVVPAFEAGRLAGLGQDPKDVPAQQPAWKGSTGAVELPVYYRWYFRTGENEDFESMVKRLEPRPADARVGIRGMDGERPGWGVAVGTDIGQIVPADEKQTVLGLEGALKAPTTTPRPTVVDPARPWFGALAAVLNEPELRLQNPATAALPVVAPPIYGEHHALRHIVDVTRADWLDALNRDPRLRVPAGFGVRVVREHQESYVARAWTQVQKVLDANRVIRLAAFAMRASEATYASVVTHLTPEKTVAFLSPLLSKVRGSPTTLRHLVAGSTLPLAALGGAMRRVARPRGVVARRLRAADESFSHGALVGALARGELTPAPPLTPPADLLSDETIVGALRGRSLPAWLVWLLEHALLVVVVVVAALVIAALALGATWMLVVAAVVVVAYAVAAPWLRRRLAAARTGPATITRPADLASALRDAPPRPDFQLVETDPVAPPEPVAGTRLTTTAVTTSTAASAVRLTQVASSTPAPGGGDTIEARGFRTAAAALERRLALGMADALQDPVRPVFALAEANAKLRAAVDPLRAFPRRVAAGVRLVFDPAWLGQAEHLVPAMAYPDFDDPMYEKLRDLSSELLLPNLQLIPPNSITLLETNPPFIEAYLAGLNYELGKELLWREYPTDRRGSYFRQFWDVKGILAEPTGESPAAVAERAKDITPLDTWPSASALGSHRNPKRPPGEQIVLTIRGDLLKKYPNTLIYAQRAHVARGTGGTPRPADPPVVTPVESDADIAREIRFPVFRAAVEPDIRFYGFDLTVEQARGAAEPRGENDDWGYYFVIQQLPGEPRFGMDVSFAPDDDSATPITWNDLAWTLLPDGTHIDVTVPPQNFTPAGPGESLAQWGADAARMAAILYQNPVMIAVHAREMLEGLA